LLEIDDRFIRIRMMKRRGALGILGLFGASLGMGRACLWDRDTLREEVLIRPTLWDLLSGQFPHHGNIYYQTRVSRLQKAGKLDVLALNDLAVAHVRLKEFDEAWKALNAARKIAPEHYETLSNMGVTAKKQGDFEKGADFISRALKIMPEGHMGLGDWYHKALVWRAEFEKATEADPPENNFLGENYVENFDDKNYGEGKKSANPPQLDKRYEQLIRNDQTFADGFVLVGDALTRTGDLHLSFVAYTWAMMLQHQHPVEVRRRRRTFLKYQEMITRKSGMRVRGVSYWKAGIAKMEKKIERGLNWLDQFKEVEGEMLKGNSDERLVDIVKVETELAKRKILRVKPD